MADQYSLNILFQVLDKATAPLRRLGRSLEGFGAKAAKVGAQLESAGRKMTALVTLPIGAALGGMTKKAIDFESAFTGVRKTVDATEGEFQKLYQGFLNLGDQIPVRTTELMGIGEAAGQLGIQTGNIMKFTKVMADLGATTNLQGDEAATSLARFANITQMSQKDFDRLGSTIVHLGNNLATTEAEIVSMGMRLAGAGANVGLTEAQIMGLSGALSSLGLRAEMGGTAFSRVMLDMGKAMATVGSKGSMMFSAIAGKGAEEFAKTFKEAPIDAVMQFVEGLDRLKNQGVNVSAVLDEMGLDGLRVTDALLRAAGSGDLLRDSMNMASGAWEKNNALTREAELRYNTTGAKLQIFINKLTRMAVSFGNLVLPSLIKVTDKLGDMFRWIEELDPGVKKMLIIFAGLAAAVGPLFLGLGLVASAIGAVTAAVFAFEVVGAPIIGTIAAITFALIGLTAAIVAVVTHWDEINEALFSGNFASNWWTGIKKITGTGEFSAPEGGVPGAVARSINNPTMGGPVGQESSAVVDIRVTGDGNNGATVTGIKTRGPMKIGASSDEYGGRTVPAPALGGQ